jgi:nucleotide-binding universal stress UspA family protein
LVPLDGSTLAEAVLPATQTLASKFEADVTLLHIVEENAPARIHGEPHLMNAEGAEAYLEKIARGLSLPEGRVRRAVRLAEKRPTARAIQDYARETGADLIVICHHGHTGLSARLFGTNAQAILQGCSVPVFLVPASATEKKPAAPYALREILAPLDGTPAHEVAFVVAAEMARAFDATVHLLSVVPTVLTLPGERAATRLLLPSATSAVLDFAERGAAEYLQARVDEIRDLRAEAMVARGEVAANVVAEAARVRADLIVMASHARPAFDAFWMGSVTPQVAQRARAPILLVRAGER